MERKTDEGWIGDHTRLGRPLGFYSSEDSIRFWNPGDSFGDEKRLVEPGEKEVRNPAIAMALRRIAMCEQAGTGLRMMQREWQALGHAAPSYQNDRAHKAFETFLPEPRSALVTIAGQVTGQITGQVLNLLRALNGEMSRGELQEALGLAHRDHFTAAYLQPALDQRLVEQTIPDKPRSSKQRYRLTELGQRVKNRGDGSPE